VASMPQGGAVPQGGNLGGGGLNPASGNSAVVPEDIPDPQTDDVVARQIREAAMAESDPALREALWDEYRRYKESISGGQ
jgi:hypothetical protein